MSAAHRNYIYYAIFLACAYICHRVPQLYARWNQALPPMTQMGTSWHRFILVSNHLPIRATKREETDSWEFEWDEDALIYQAQVHVTLRAGLALLCTAPLKHSKALVNHSCKCCCICLDTWTQTPAETQESQ